MENSSVGAGLVRFFVRRYDPDCDQETTVQYVVPSAKDMTVLEALLYVRDHDDASLAFEFGCRYGVCCWCVISIDGALRLACRTPLKQDQELRPSRRLPVIRDLVVDRSTMKRSCGSSPMDEP